MPTFVWSSKDCQVLGDGLPDAFYAIGGPEHEHWRKIRDDLRASGCYDKFAHVFNRLAFQDPVYLILALGVAEYVGALGKGAATSWTRMEEARAERSKKEAKI